MKVVVPLLLILSQVVLGSIPWPVDPYSSTILQCQGDHSSCSWRIDFILFETPFEMTMINIIDGDHYNFGYLDASTGECDLLIEKVYPQMSGSFACISKITLEDGTVTEEILEKYTVIAQELSDFFLTFDDQRYENQERIRPNLEKNETYEFVCGVTATPPPNMKWIFNNTRDITADSVLTQPDPNSLEKYISTLTLETSASGEQSLACVIRKDYATQEEIISVNFVVGDIDLEANAYTSTILPCDVDSDSCVWEIETSDGEMNSYNMTEIKEDIHLKYGYSNESIGDCDLLIKETVPADSGLYVCNELNMFWESYRLTVYVGPDTIPLPVDPYSSTILQCQGHRMSCSWRIEFKLFEITFEMTMINIIDGDHGSFGHSDDSTGECDLLIEKVYPQMSGSYACISKNSLEDGTVTEKILQSYTVIAQEISHPILSFDGKTYNDNDELEDDLPLNQTYEFQCEVERAFPEPTIKWLHNEEGDVTEYSEMEVVQSDLDSASYTNTLFFEVTTKGEQSLQCVVTHPLISDKETVTLFFDGGSATIGVSAFSLVSVLVLVVMPTYLHY